MNHIGTWWHETNVPIGGGIMQINLIWTFEQDGRAFSSKSTVLVHGGKEKNLMTKEENGTWKWEGENVRVDIPGHENSPFLLSVVSDNELKSELGAVWHRQ
jgi:hypothetical protein